jgi:transcriptional antiterminator RfaH
MTAWYVCRTKPAQEVRAAVELTRQQFPVYMPLLDSKPMFPGYVFVEFDIRQPGWGVIRSTRGCSGLLATAGIPSPVPNKVMDALRQFATKESEPTPEAKRIYSCGQQVRISEGPLKGMEGLFVADKRKRISCLLEIMGKRIEMPLASIVAA